MTAPRQIAVVGADGFIGRNLVLRLSELPAYAVMPLTRGSSGADWRTAVERCDVLINLAGVNRPPDPAAFSGNYEVVDRIVDLADHAGRAVPIVHLSSAKALDSTPYGLSKKVAEDRLLAFAERSNSPVALLRLPNVFGKWCRPNYNSAVATFCHNIVRDLPIRVDDPSTPLDLLYIDDLLDTLLELIGSGFQTGFHTAAPIHGTTVGTVAKAITGFRDDRAENLIANVGHGLLRALYSTYVSYLPPAEFAYPIAAHTDPRGSFSEMLKTRDAGQFSFFTAHPGVTRGGHYHHSKTEKFLIVHGQALFRFRHMLTGELHEVRTDAASPTVVDTVPGWTHDVTNVGDGVMVAMLWANELFDRDRPDTIAQKV